MDFAKPKDLADYLVYLDKNKTAYNSYFKWKKYIKIRPSFLPVNMICDICIQLNLERYFGIESKQRDSMDFLNKRHCKTPDPKKEMFFNLKDL
jgi:hypothetical protein